MNKSTQSKISILGFCLLLLNACNWSANEDLSPETVALEFFDNIYNHNDIEKAVKLATPKYARILQHYGNTKRVQSVLFNRRYDKVDIQLSKDVRFKEGISPQAEQTTVTVLLDGSYAGNRYKDLKFVLLKRQPEGWRVEKLKTDPYR
ncbi:hypothetical protein [Gayadomonas joobiniege]|uniref:hypothetical protein n=1 Tax=Gayadomonas joobiniege TaxID=1234606 RepID=UPI0003812764|nr:hypothetical protein [Gayadomonas joobiniege]